MILDTRIFSWNIKYVSHIISKSLFFRELSKDQEVVTESKYGSVQFRLPGSPFAPTCGKDSATLGKLFVRSLLQDLYVIGYDFLCSVDLSRAYDQGTLIFKKGKNWVNIIHSNFYKLWFQKSPVRDFFFSIKKVGTPKKNNSDH